MQTIQHGLGCALLAALLLTGCASTPQVFSDFDPRHDFTQDKNFTWVQDPPMLRAGDYPLSALAESRMTAAIKNEMIAKGYTFVADPEQADLALVYTMGARDKIKVVQYPVPHYRHRYEWGWGGHYFPYFVHYPFEREYLYIEEMRSYTDGTIALDIFDAKTNTPIWHTKASKRLSKKDLNANGRNAVQIVSNLLKHFPLVGCEPVVSKECRPFNIHEQHQARPESDD